MAAAYESWITQLRLSWMSATARSILGALAAVVGDRSVAWAKQALYEHLPERAQDATSIYLTASERVIEPGPAETTTALASRLSRAVLQWTLAGTPMGLLLALYYAGFVGAVVVQQNGLGYTLTGTPNLDDVASLVSAIPGWYQATTLGAGPPAVNGHPWWLFDTQYTFCSRFAVLFPASAPNPQLGIAANLARLQRVVKRWKPAKATCVAIYVATGKFVGWPVRNVNDGGTVGPSTVTSYSAGS